MAEEEKKAKKTAQKAKAEKKPAAAKPAAKKDAAKPAKKTAAPKKKTPAGKALRVTQVGSPIGRKAYQRATLIGLGLNKLHRSRVLEDTPAVRDMIAKVSHLVKVEDVA